MSKKDIFNILRFDVERVKKPKKSLDDFLVGDEDIHAEMKKKKAAPTKKKPLEEDIGGSLADTEANRPYINKVDWGSLNKMSHELQARTLRREYLTLLEKVEELSDKLVSEQAQKGENGIVAEKYKREVNAIREFTTEIISFIPDAHDIKIKLDTTPWELEDVREDIIHKLKSLVNKVRFAEKVMEDEMKEVLAQKKFLENELYRTREHIRTLELKGNQAIVGERPQVPSPKVNEEQSVIQSELRSGNNVQSAFENITVEQKIQDNPIFVSPFEFKQPIESSYVAETPTQPTAAPPLSDDMPKYLFIEVERYLENLSDESKYALEIIGRTGVSRNAELKTAVEETEEGRKHFFPGGKFNKNALNEAVKLLKDRQFLDATNVKLGSKGGYDFLAYELTDIGKAIYYKFAAELPKEPEMAQVLRDHKTLEHGYLIKEVAISLRTAGYTVHEDRENCTYKLPDGRRQVFDLIAEKDGEKMHIEVERGTHNEADFFEKMDKFLLVTNEMYFVAPKKEILYQVTKGKVFKWITERLGGFENAKGKVKLRFATFENIKKNVNNPWEKFEP